MEKEEAHPNAVAAKTGRTRGAENVNLNKLQDLSFVKKKREVYFKAMQRAKQT